MNIYLCSRVAKDAHELNNTAAKALRELGHTVFVPHEQHYNEIMEGTAHHIDDSAIYHQDMEAMGEADVCVAVGRLGVDCAFEVGWFQGQGIPVYWLLPTSVEAGRHPMLYEAYRTRELAGRDGLLCRITNLNAMQGLDKLYHKLYTKG